MISSSLFFRRNPRFSPKFIQSHREEFMENLSELSTFRISYPQFLGFYPQFWEKSGQQKRKNFPEKLDR
jgi:hypothetical protein